MPQAKIFTYMYAQTVQVFITTILLCSLVPKAMESWAGPGNKANHYVGSSLLKIKPRDIY